MALFKKKREEKGTSNVAENATVTREAMECQKLMADTAMESENYKQAAEIFQNIINLHPEETDILAYAYHHMGNIQALGLVSRPDFMQAAACFHQAALLGDDYAEQLCAKSTLDFFVGKVDTSTPKQLYEDAVTFVKNVYPDAFEYREITDLLVSMADFYLKKGDYARGRKFVRGAAEFCDETEAQRIMGVFYLQGESVEKSDLAAMYWFHKAASKGEKSSLQHREGILNSYRQNWGDEETKEQLDILISMCMKGCEQVPKDEASAAYWTERKQELS